MKIEIQNIEEIKKEMEMRLRDYEFFDSEESEIIAGIKEDIAFYEKLKTTLENYDEDMGDGIIEIGTLEEYSKLLEEIEDTGVEYRVFSNMTIYLVVY